jgi:SAM-dependent methyltransferase
MRYQAWELKYFDKANNFRKYQFNLIKSFLKDTTAEVGPGNGTNFKYYKKFVKKVTFFEPDKKLFNNLKKKFKKKVIIKNSFFEKKKNYYDTILYFDVIEHIKKDNDEIRNAIFSLKKNGNLIIAVPAFNTLYSKFDEDIGHYRRYKKNDFLKYQNKNIKIVKSHYYDSVGFILSFLSKFISSNYRKNIKTKIFIWNLLIPISQILDKIILNLFGKSLVVIFRKI